MITAVDTNVLLDILVRSSHADESNRTLTAAARQGALIVNELVYAELAAHFPGEEELRRFLADTDIKLEPSRPEALYRCGLAWRRYSERRPHQFICPNCGTRQETLCFRCHSVIQSRQHVIADFVIGAHALVQADRLLTRDRGYFAAYFPELRLML